MAKGKKPLVVVTRKLPDTVETRMCELFDTRLNIDDKPMSHAELAEAVKEADVLVPTVTDRIDAALLGQSGEKLRLIANWVAGRRPGCSGIASGASGSASSAWDASARRSRAAPAPSACRSTTTI